MPTSDTLRLPISFRPALLLRDLESIPTNQWIRHFVAQNYVGDWSGIALRGPADAVHPIQSLIAHSGTTNWANTDVLEACPYFQEVLSFFQSPLLSVRLLRLGPGSEIKEHVDHSLSFESGEVRLHVPIVTNPSLEFLIEGKPVVLLPGELWYLNVELRHSVQNRGATPRVHMVIDTVVNAWLRGLFDQAQSDSSTG